MIDKLTKIFQQGEVLKAEDLNNISSRVNEVIDHLNNLQIPANYVIAEDINRTLSLSSVIINDGAASTGDLSVNVRFAYAGAPTHYMLSESPSFSGATWKPFANPASFQLSTGDGSKTVYAKIKDASGESTVVSDSIAYAPSTEVSLSSVIINNGAASTMAQEVSIQFTYSGSPTYYKLSESPSFDGASWIAFSNPASFMLSAGYGDKTVYAKIKNANNESSVVNDSIAYSATTPLSLSSISINQGALSTPDRIISVAFVYSGAPTHYMLSESPSFSGATWKSFANPASFQSSTGAGSKTVYAKIKDASGESTVVNGSISYVPEIGDIDFIDNEFKRVMVSKFDTSGNGKISMSEAEVNKDLGSAFFNNTSLVSANELKYFKNSSTTFNGCFKGCTKLESIEYPPNWKIGSGEHDGNIKLSRVILPANLETIPATAFQKCSSLESLDIPEGVKTIAITAFLNSGLTRITIPGSVTNIGDLGKDCPNLIFADLGAGVTNFGASAFVGSKLTTLVCRAITPPTMGYGALKDITAEIYVPDSSVLDYRSSTPWWSSHAARIHPLSEYVD